MEAPFGLGLLELGVELLLLGLGCLDLRRVLGEHALEAGEGLHILESGAVALGEPGLKLQLTGFLFVQLLLDFIVVFHDFFLRFK